MLSPVVWTSVATGVEPTRHGILDFLVEGEEGRREPVTSAQRKVPTIWEMLSRGGVEVGVVGWWASWPADPVKGYQVSDRLAYQLFGYRADPDDATGKTWPPHLYDEIRPLLVRPESVGWDRVQPYLAGPRRDEEEFTDDEHRRLDELRTLIASGETYLGVARNLSRRFSPRLEIVYFEGTDTVGHLFMPFRSPALPDVDPVSAQSFESVVDRYYETADSFIGSLLEDPAGNRNVIVLSDHGFASDATRPRTTDSRIGHGPAADWHRRFGMLVLSGPAFRHGELKEATIYDVAPTVLALFGEPVPRSWPGRVLEDALSESFLAGYSPRYREDDPVRDERGSATIEDPAAADVLDKLRALGYVSPEGEAPGDLTGGNNAGLALMAEGRYAEAEREFRTALEGRDSNSFVLVNLALSLRYQGQDEEAAALLERALSDPASGRVAADQLAQIRLEEGDHAGAIRLVEKVLEVEPNAAEVRNTFGLILEAMGNYEGAEAQFRKSSDLDPHACLARNNLGNLMKREGRSKDAEGWYLAAIEADPYFMGAYNNLALIYQERGEMDRAVDLYNRALGKAPGNAVVLNNLGSLHFHGREFDLARETWSRAVEADPGYASPLNNLAGLWITLRRYDEAEALLTRALELEPEYGDARTNLALVLLARGDDGAAADQLRHAVEDPRCGALTWNRLGLLELRLERPEAARDAWRRSLAIDPDQALLVRQLTALERRLEDGG